MLKSLRMSRLKKSNDKRIRNVTSMHTGIADIPTTSKLNDIIRSLSVNDVEKLRIEKAYSSRAENSK